MLLGYELNYLWLRFDLAMHLGYYIPNNLDLTYFSSDLLKFKKGEVAEINYFSEKSSIELKQLDAKFDFIIRVLGNDEINGCSLYTPLDNLGDHLSKVLGGMYVRGLLKKKFGTEPTHTMSRNERFNLIRRSPYIISDDQYITDSHGKLTSVSCDFNNKRILIIDDIVTSGSTLLQILNVLKTKWEKASYFAYCLGKTNSDRLSNIDANHPVYYPDFHYEFDNDEVDYIKLIKDINTHNYLNCPPVFDSSEIFPECYDTSDEDDLNGFENELEYIDPESYPYKEYTWYDECFSAYQFEDYDGEEYEADDFFN